MKIKERNSNLKKKLTIVLIKRQLNQQIQLVKISKYLKIRNKKEKFTYLLHTLLQLFF